MCYVLQFYKDNKKTYPICGSFSSGRHFGMLLRWDVSGSLISQAMFLDLGGPNFV
jgi:hypothetical protein